MPITTLVRVVNIVAELFFWNYTGGFTASFSLEVSINKHVFVVLFFVQQYNAIKILEWTD
jgi:hypothetical protein